MPDFQLDPRVDRLRVLCAALLIALAAARLIAAVTACSGLRPSCVALRAALPELEALNGIAASVSAPSTLDAQRLAALAVAALIPVGLLREAYKRQS
jgi:hypothetical protein